MTVPRGRVLLIDIAMAIVAVSIWTFAPLMALWIGSRVQGDGPPSMGAVFLVAICMLAFVLVLVRLLAILDAAHQRATGRTPQVRRHAPWLRSMRGERERYEGEAIQFTALERTLVIVVAIAFVIFEIWFFFFSSSPIDQRSGRSADRGRPARTTLLVGGAQRPDRVQVRQRGLALDVVAAAPRTPGLLAAVGVHDHPVLQTGRVRLDR